MSKSLEQLVDEAMTSGEFLVLQLFRCKDGSYSSNLRRSWTDAYVCGQLIDADATPSAHIRHLLEHVIATKPPSRSVEHQQSVGFDDLL